MRSDNGGDSLGGKSNNGNASGADRWS